MAATAWSERPNGAGEALSSLLATDGSAGHPYLRATALTGSDHAIRNLADVAHFVCLLHGRHPGLIDLAAHRAVDPDTRDFIHRAASGFAAERNFLTHLVVAAGPMPSTLGQARSEAAVVGQVHALATLARSERNGTALGAVLALILDWHAIRGLLDHAARRFGLEPPPLDLPGVHETIEITGIATANPGVERAIVFGAQQLLIQHRGLWDLLETREGARREA